MRLRLFSILGAFISVSLATAIDDNYEDLGPSVAAGIPQIGLYNGLQYHGWAVGQQPPVTPGLLAHTPNMSAVAVTTLTTATGNPGEMTPGPGVKCFDALSFYFGCNANVQSGILLEAAVACTISVSGYHGDKQVGEAAFNFGQPENPLKTPMLLADLSNRGYKCLTNITLAVSSPLAGAILVIDDFVHVNYKK